MCFLSLFSCDFVFRSYCSFPLAHNFCSPITNNEWFYPSESIGSDDVVDSDNDVVVVDTDVNKPADTDDDDSDDDIDDDDYWWIPDEVESEGQEDEESERKHPDIK